MSKKAQLSMEEVPSMILENMTNDMLKKMVEELERTKVKLLLNVKDLETKLEQQKEDQKDVYFYLNKKCDESYEVIAGLEEQILNEQSAREASEKNLERQIEDQKFKYNSEELKYLGKIAELEEQINELSDYRERKQETEGRLEKLLKTLEEERKQFARNLTDLENRAAYERNKLRREYEQNLELFKQEAIAKRDDELPEITSKAIESYNRIREEINRQVKLFNLSMSAFN
jgi:hypothetical protein